MSRPRLEDLEASAEDAADLLAALAWLAIDAVPVDEAELRGAQRRAMLVLAAGGDPHRELTWDIVPVVRLAAELDSPPRREALEAALAGFEAEGLPAVSEALGLLLADPDLAWRMYALAVVADALAEE